MLVEHDGPWGQAVLRDARLPDAVRAHLDGHRGVKVLLARRHSRADRLGGCRVFVCFPGRRELLTASFEDHRDLLDLDLAALGQRRAPAGMEVHNEPVYGVCTHGRHDVCCAEQGRPVARALAEARQEQTWEVSHMGGDRYAANAVVLPYGLYYGRLAPDDVPDLVAAEDRHELLLPRLRGRTSRPMPVQYAEIALRRHLDEAGHDAVQLQARDGLTTEWLHRPSGGRWRLRVERSLGTPDLLTCGADRVNPVPRLSLAELSALPAA